MSTINTIPDDVAAIKDSPELLVLKFGEVFKIGSDEERTVEGYASTNDLDEYRDIIEPPAFEGSLTRYMQYPMVCLNHDWMNQVGSALDCRIDGKGLWCKLKISAAEPGLWTKIKEGVYRAFSIAGRIVKSEYDDENKIRRIKELMLYEISIVGLPANRQARIELARSMHGAILNGNINRNTQEGNMAANLDPQKSTTPPDVAALVEPEVNKQLGARFENLNKHIDSAVAKETKQAVTDALRDESSELGKAIKLMNQVLEAQKNAVTAAEFKQFKDNIQGDLASAAMGYQRSNIERPKNEFSTFPIDAYSLREVLNPDAVTKSQAADAQELGMHPLIYRLSMVDPIQLNALDGERVANFQKHAQKVALVHAIMCNSKSYRNDGARRLKTLKCFQGLQREFESLTKGVGMDTATAAEGLEWVPTIMNSELIRRIEIEAMVARKFRRETMPSATWDWPVLGTGPVTYVMSQATTDSMTALITASVAASAKVTLTATKAGCWVPISTELVEDAVISTLNVVQDDMILAFIRGLDDAIINGDATGAHQDTDVEAVTAHNNKLFDGLRVKALAASASKHDCGGDALVAMDLRAMRKKLTGARGAATSELAIIVSVNDWINLMSDDDVRTVDKFGQEATWLKGTLLAIDAIPIILSDFARTDVNASGVNGASANTFSTALLVHLPSWAIGDRRQVTVESDKVIWTDQLHLVGTWRGTFKNIKTQNYPVVIGYNIDPT